MGDGALGFWKAVRKVYPKARWQRCWMHKTGNILNNLPRKSQSAAKKAIQDIWMAETKEAAEKALDCFEEAYGAKYPKAVECIQDDQELLLTHFDFPAEHWKHLRTSNAIESPFATVRLRQRATKGSGSRNKALLMAFKLLDMAQKRWRKLNGAELLPLVRAGVKFVDGVRQEREKEKKTGRKEKAA